MRYLLEKGAHLGTSGGINPQEIGEMCWSEHGITIAKLILEPIDLDAQLVRLPRNEMSMFLRYAAATGDEAIIKKFGTPRTATEVKSALENAARHGHVLLVKILLDRCAEFGYEGSERAENYLDVISVAADFNQQAVVRVVLDRAEQRGISLRPPRALQLAAKNDHDAICRLLVERGAPCWMIAKTRMRKITTSASF